MRTCRWRWLAPALALVAGATTTLRDTPSAQACSCVGPSSQLWAPLDDQPAALNSRITLSLPTNKRGTLVVRPLGGVPITTSEERFDAVRQQLVVLTPDTPLAANTRYEVAWINEPQHPRTLVFGTFATGDFKDDKGPLLEPIQHAVFHDETVMAMTSCQSRERWLELDVAPAKDERGDAVLYGLWVADSRGKLDLTKPPLTWVPRRQSPDSLIFGATGMCSPLRVALPTKPGRLPIAIAAIDSAGNRSPARRAVVTVPKSKP